MTLREKAYTALPAVALIGLWPLVWARILPAPVWLGIVGWVAEGLEE